MSAQQEHATKPSDDSASPPKETPAAWFEAGLRLLQAGQLAEAEQCGRSALALDQAHADSLHLMGMLCVAAGQHDLAIQWIAMAIRQNPDVADYFCNLGMALQRKDRLDEAIRCFDRALLLNPNQAGVWLRMGEILRHQKRLDEAIKCFDRAVTVNPDQPEVWFAMGEMLRQEKRIDEALLSFDQAVKLKPDYRDAANASGGLYFEAKRFEEAAARFTRSVEIDPSQSEAFNFISRCQWGLLRFEEALANGMRAFELAPDNPVIIKNVGVILQKLGRDEEALIWFDRALALRPDFASVLADRFTTLFALRRIEEAFADIDRAIALDPECADYHWNRALMRLLLGDFDAGWPAREWGHKVALVGFVDRQFTKPRWFGEEPVAGKTVLLYSDEGLGDTVQYSRYASMVAKLGARVILEVDSPLHPLLTGMEGVTLCVPRIKDVVPPDFDLHCPLSGLPLAFKTRLETIPAPPSYLPPLPEARVQHWRNRLGTHDKLRVGLVWSGNPLHANDRNRSTTLRTMLAISDDRASFYSLQKEPHPADQVTLSERTDIIDLTADLTDFVETAALISCLDLVVTVDTSVAHLAAALGRPTWILLPFTPDYRWLLGRNDSPWYPSVRLFRQDQGRDYAKVLDRVRAELGALISAFQPG
jgi:tetratricopeptide (TPR) repeat protein